MKNKRRNVVRQEKLLLLESLVDDIMGILFETLDDDIQLTRMGH
jgi:hypothetical protein